MVDDGHLGRVERVHKRRDARVDVALGRGLYRTGGAGYVRLEHSERQRRRDRFRFDRRSHLYRSYDRAVAG